MIDGDVNKINFCVVAMIFVNGHEIGWFKFKKKIVLISNGTSTTD